MVNASNREVTVLETYEDVVVEGEDTGDRERRGGTPGSVRGSARNAGDRGTGRGTGAARSRSPVDVSDMSEEELIRIISEAANELDSRITGPPLPVEAYVSRVGCGSAAVPRAYPSSPRAFIKLALPALSKNIPPTQARRTGTNFPASIIGQVHRPLCHLPRIWPGRFLLVGVDVLWSLPFGASTRTGPPTGHPRAVDRTSPSLRHSAPS